MNYSLVLFDTPQNVGLTITSTISIIVALIALAGTVVSRKVKTPADELARADFAYKKIADRLDEVNKDRDYLQSVIEMLRSQLAKLDSDAVISMDDKRKLRNLIDQGEVRIEKLIDENGVLHKRLMSIGEKVRKGQTITLYDVYGETGNIKLPSIENIDSVVSPDDPLSTAMQHENK